VAHPAGAITQYLQFFGPHIFILWKLALLKKRVIFYAPPPIGVVCYRVYCTCLLTGHVLRGDLDLDCNPMFYVNVNDIDTLQTTGQYVACTSERILQSKTELYDVFVDQQHLMTPLASLDPILRLTPADKERYDLLNSIRSNQLITSGGVGDSQNDDYGFVAFFRELNSQLLRTMIEAVEREDHLMTVDMVESVGLDPARDRNFLTELAAQLNFNLNVQRPSDMMDILSCCC
jgi:hypothetical protein